MEKYSRVLWLFWLCAACHPGETNWSSEWLSPLAKSRLTLQQLTGDTLLKANTSQQLVLSYRGNVLDLALDTLAQLEAIDTEDTIFWDFGQILIPPNVAIPLNPIEIRFDVPQADIIFARLKEGFAQITFKSRIPRKVRFKYTIPLATKNGFPLQFEDELPAWDGGPNPQTFSRSVSLAGYNLDLRGSDLISSNRIQIQVTPTIAPGEDSLLLTQNMVLFSIENQLSQLEANYLQGALYPQDLALDLDTLRVDLLKNMEAGLLDLESATLDLSLINTLGAELRVRPAQLKARNTRNGNSIDLQHALVGSTVFLNRATGGPTIEIPVATSHLWQLNDQNSNLVELLELLPDELILRLNVSVNPLGNTAGLQDFVYPAHLPQLRVDAEVPLKFSLEGLKLTDTLEADLTQLAELNHLLEGELKLFAKNQFPFEFKLTLISLDAQYHPLDTLLKEAVLEAAPLDGNLRVIQPFESTLIAPIRPNDVFHLKNTTHFLVNAELNTLPQGIRLWMYQEYGLDIQLVVNALVQSQAQ